MSRSSATVSLPAPAMSLPIASGLAHVANDVAIAAGGRGSLPVARGIASSEMENRAVLRLYTAVYAVAKEAPCTSVFGFPVWFSA